MQMSCICTFPKIVHLSEVPKNRSLARFCGESRFQVDLIIEKKVDHLTHATVVDKHVYISERLNVRVNVCFAVDPFLFDACERKKETRQMH